jgi:hypothetical protein
MAGYELDDEARPERLSRPTTLDELAAGTEGMVRS